MTEMPQPASADDLSTILTVLRTARGWSQQDLARAAGVQASSISNYERGKSQPQQRTLSQLVAAMGLPLSAVDLTRNFLQSLGALQTLEAEPADAVSARIHAVSSEAGKVVTQIAASLLTFILQELPRREGEAAETGSLESAAPLPDGSPAAEGLWAALWEQPFARQEDLVREDRAFRDEGLFDLLCRESERLGAHDPKRAVEAAQLAVLAALGLREEDGRGARRVAYAQARRANALRISGSLPAAEAAFVEAERWWAEAKAAGEPIAPDDEGRMLSLKASLRQDQRRIPEALELLERAISIAGSAELKATILIKKASTLNDLQRLEEALELLDQAAPLVDARQSPRLFHCLRHNRLDCLSKLGRFQEARVLAAEVHALCRALGNDLDLLRLRWVEARIEAGLGQTGKAIETLTQVRREFAARGIAYDSALVTLDLTVLYARTGWAADVKALARRLVPLFEAQGVPQEASAALALFRQATEK